jgi:hypothetical protein
MIDNNEKNNIKGALDYAITMFHLRAKREGIELLDNWGVWEQIKEEYNIMGIE